MSQHFQGPFGLKILRALTKFYGQLAGGTTLIRPLILDDWMGPKGDFPIYLYSYLICMNWYRYEADCIHLMYNQWIMYSVQ